MAVLAAFWCDGKGGAEAIDPGDKSAEELLGDRDGYIWVHLQRPNADDEDWLNRSGVDAYVHEVLITPETRPRCSVHGEGVLINLRGVNLNEGAEPEDMVSLRIWATGELLVSVQRRHVFAVNDVTHACQRQVAPPDTGELVSRLALRLSDRAEPVVVDLMERVDDLETGMEEEGAFPSRAELADVRRMSIMLRRYMLPQRDALSTFAIEDMLWLCPEARLKAREASERVGRLAESLDAIRDRAEVVHDQIMDSRAEQNNRQMLVLSVVAAIFLPLSLVTGLLGINVGGLPGEHSPHAFLVVCGVLLAVCVVQIWVFYKLGMLKRWR
jgi:zinc transporter